jgi:hypothetical protein
MTCTHNHLIKESNRRSGPNGSLRVTYTCSRCGATREHDWYSNGRSWEGKWTVEKAADQESKR